MSRSREVERPEGTAVLEVMTDLDPRQAARLKAAGIILDWEQRPTGVRVRLQVGE